MAQAPGKRAAATQAAPTLNLARMWQGDLAEPFAAFLPLNSIGVVGKLSRRCRDRLPAVFFNLARKHGALRASMTGFVDAIRDTGRDDSWYSGEALESWVRREPREDEGPFTAEDVDVDGSRCIKITTSAPGSNPVGHNVEGALIKEFAAAEKLCVRQVKYRFCFTDLDPTVSHSSPYQHGFAFFTLGPYGVGEQFHQRGLLVEPTNVPANGYRLIWWDQGSDGDILMNVTQGTWYDVTMDFDWNPDAWEPHPDDPNDPNELVVWISITGEDGNPHRIALKTPNRQLLTSFGIYNFSASVTHYSSIRVQYSKHTSRDGILRLDADSDSDEE